MLVDHNTVDLGERERHGSTGADNLAWIWVDSSHAARRPMRGRGMGRGVARRIGSAYKSVRTCVVEFWECGADVRGQARCSSMGRGSTDFDSVKRERRRLPQFMEAFFLGDEVLLHGLLACTGQAIYDFVFLRVNRRVPSDAALRDGFSIAQMPGVVVVLFSAFFVCCRCLAAG